MRIFTGLVILVLIITSLWMAVLDQYDKAAFLMAVATFQRVTQVRDDK